MNPDRTREIVRLTTVLALALALAACAPTRSQADVLRELHAENEQQFAALSPCMQIHVYAVVSPPYVDIDHAVALVPDWMNRAIAQQSPDVLATCIAEEGRMLLVHWNDDPSMYQENSLKLHALLYKAAQLHLLNDPKVLDLSVQVLCHTQYVYEKGRIAILMYVDRHPSLINYPSVVDMETELCR